MCVLLFVIVDISGQLFDIVNECVLLFVIVDVCVCHLL